MRTPSNPAKRGQGRFWQRIQGKLTLLLIALLVPTLLAQINVFKEWYEQTRETELQSNLEVARAVALGFESFVQDILHQELAMGIAMTSAAVSTEADRNRILNENKAGNPAVWTFIWAQPDGMVIAATEPKLMGKDLRDRDYYEEIVAGRDWVVSDLLLSRISNRPSFTISRGVRNGSGQLIGIMIAGILPEQLDEVLAVKRSKGGGHAIVDRHGVLVYRYPSINPTWEERNWLKDFPEFGEALAGRETSRMVFAPFEGKNRLVSFTSIPAIGWAVSAGRTEEIAIAAVTSQVFPHAVLLFAVTGAAFGIAFLFSRRIANSVSQLRSHAAALGAGQTQDLAVASGPSELRELADSFNEMSARLRSRENNLLEQREWFRVTLSSIGDAVMTTDTTGGVTFLNPVASALTGWSLEEALGVPAQRIFRIINEKTREPAEDIVKRVLSDGSTVALANHTALITREGREIPIEDSAAPIKYTNGNVIGTVLVFHDVTERRHAREALREGEERLRLLGDNLPESAVYQYVHEPDGRVRFLHFSAGIERLNGVSVETVLRDPGTLHRQILPDYFRRLVEAEARSSREMSDFDMEVPMQRPDGAVRWMRLHSRPRRLPDGRTIWDGVQIDVTERRRMEEELRRNELRFRLLSEAADRLLAARKPQEIVEELCGKVMAHLDCHAFFNFLVVDEKAGKLHLNACAGIPDDEAGKIEWLDFGVAVCGCVAQQGERIVAEDIFHIPDCRTELIKSYGIQAYACHPLMAQGRLIGTLSFGSKTRTAFSPEDLALMKTVADQVAVAMERMALIEQLQRSRDELELRVEERTAELHTTMERLEQSNQALQDFASIASHDMQEPLRKIRSFGNRLSQACGSKLGEEGGDYLKRMLNAAERMQDLLDALLKYSRVTTKADPFVELNLNELIAGVISDLEARIEETGGRVEVADLPRIEADPNQMRQLFQNLIGNALKYHGQETPMVRIYGEACQDSLRIHVEDNGIGFDERYIDRIFQPFQRLHGRSSRFEGTGMGLAICKKIVERHGGSITARSEQGRGARFTISLPFGLSSGLMQS